MSNDALCINRFWVRNRGLKNIEKYLKYQISFFAAASQSGSLISRNRQVEIGDHYSSHETV